LDLSDDLDDEGSTEAAATATALGPAEASDVAAGEAVAATLATAGVAPATDPVERMTCADDEANCAISAARSHGRTHQDRAREEGAGVHGVAEIESGWSEMCCGRRAMWCLSKAKSGGASARPGRVENASKRARVERVQPTYANQSLRVKQANLHSRRAI